MTSLAPPTDAAGPELRRRTERGVSFLEAGQGTPVVLLHGIPGSALAWAAVGARLAGDCRVVIPDLAGFGQSAAPAGDYYMEAQARAVRELLARLDIGELVLGGHDFGGPVALTLLRLHPELRVRGLILSATNLFTDTPVPPPLRLARVPGIGPAMFRLMAGTRVGLWLMYQAATAGKSQATWARFRCHLTAGGMDLTWRIFQRSLADLETNYRPIEALLPGLDLPALVLWGDRDPFFAVSVGERSHRAIPGSVLRVLPGTGHFVPEEQPDRVAAEIREILRVILPSG